MAASAVLGALFWSLSAFHDWLAHYEGMFWQILVTDVPSNELFSRIFVFGLYLIIGTIMAGMVAKRQQDP
jgi:hypothetical protein